MYKIVVLNDYNNSLFAQLKQLIKRFAIDIFIVQKFDLSNKSFKEKKKYIDNYEKYLTSEDLDYLENHEQYICGSCGRCICIDEHPDRKLRRWNFPFKTFGVAKLYLRTEAENYWNKIF